MYVIQLRPIDEPTIHALKYPYRITMFALFFFKYELQTMCKEPEDK